MDWQRRQLGIGLDAADEGGGADVSSGAGGSVAPRAPAVGAQQEAQAIREHQMRTRGMRKRVQMRRRAADCRDWVPASIVVRKETRIVARRFQFQSLNRGNNPHYPATVSSFRLDRFKVTVGRFRAFFKAQHASLPRGGTGAHPGLPDTGWWAEK